MPTKVKTDRMSTDPQSEPTISPKSPSREEIECQVVNSAPSLESFSDYPPPIVVNILQEESEHSRVAGSSPVEPSSRDNQSTQMPLFGCNNDSKRMGKFGKADGATVNDAYDELRDNSEDAGSTNTITYYDKDTRTFTHEDNGRGMGLDALKRMSDLDSHNPDRDDGSTTGQHGIGDPRAKTVVSCPEFDKDWKVVESGKWTVKTTEKRTTKAYALTCDYMKLNDNNRLSDCFTCTEYEEEYDVSYMKLEMTNINDKIHNGLLAIQEKVNVKDISHLKENINIKTSMTWNKPFNINNAYVDVMPNSFELSDSHVSTYYKIKMYKREQNGNILYPLCLKKVNGDEEEHLGWVNCRTKNYNDELDDESSKSKNYNYLPDGEIVLRLAANTDRYHIATKKKGKPACINPQIYPDKNQVEFFKSFIEGSVPESGTPSCTTFNKGIIETFYKDTNVIMKTSSYHRCLGTLPFIRRAGLKGNDATLTHELESIKKDLFITKSADKYLKFSREIKSNIDIKLVPDSLMIAINHCMCNFRKVIVSKIKDPLERRRDAKAPSTVAGGAGGGGSTSGGAGDSETKSAVPLTLKTILTPPTVNSIGHLRKNVDKRKVEEKKALKAADTAVRRRIQAETDLEDAVRLNARRSTIPPQGIADGDILLGENGTHDTEAGNVAVVAIAEVRLSTPGSGDAAAETATRRRIQAETYLEDAVRVNSPPAPQTHAIGGH
tara:strand:- start:987 stop:3149 length:2163 start_codon:yes stop_codon:yes gene_type:complete